MVHFAVFQPLILNNQTYECNPMFNNVFFRLNGINHNKQEHVDKGYAKLAQAQGYRSRAIFKLKEIQEKDQLIKPGMNIVDLGAAPGGWSQYARPLMGNNNKLVALDILPMETLENVLFIQGDFREQTILDQLYDALAGDPVHLVMSDMVPNMFGSKHLDYYAAQDLCELALDAAKTLLTPGGSFLVKAFHGEEFESFHKDIQQHFDKVLIRKPKSSKLRAYEVYILAKGFKSPKPAPI